MDWQKFYTENPRDRVKAIDRKVYSVGVNDLPYVVMIKHEGKLVYQCEFYRKWEKILRRCYASDRSDKHPSYDDCSVSDDFLSASAFKEWMIKQIWFERGVLLHLDKDIINPFARTYSNETCAFVPDVLNYALYTGERVKETTESIGVRKVTLKSGGFSYAARSTDKEHLGTFNSNKAAHKAWQHSKLDRLNQVLSEYRSMECYREDVDVGMCRRVTMLEKHIKNDFETVNMIV